ncbi:ThiF family adenylyltransferase [Alicyclobacillus acidiphilus]|uniref:ThiF family adenylyltransferase n=1 Tax=Alicyclobacillus acidiphilus TaxID=182455 RepID=UPI00082A8FA0|nr:ThiF family adenylyltransferase [Alicyclobacillus acidiphilus]
MERDRYSRQILFRPIGREGQSKLAQSRVAIVGMGALGTVSASHLVRAGVGYVRLIDRDVVEESNLQRQSLYLEADALQHRPKAEAAAQILREANSEVVIEPIVDDLHATNAEWLLSDVDVIVDGTDNFQVRYLMNDISVKHGIPWSYGGAVSSHGVTAFFRPEQTPCFVCLFGSDASMPGHDTCDTVGVISPVVSMIASLQTADVLKYLTGNEARIANRATHLDVWANDYYHTELGQPREDCPCCKHHQYRALDAKSGAMAVSLCGRATVQVRPDHPVAIDMEAFARRLAAFGKVNFNGHILRCELDGATLTLFQDGRALVHGTSEPAVARMLYARYVGM